MRHTWLLLGAIFVLTLTAAAPVHAGSKMVWNFKPDKGFIDNPVAFDAQQKRLAYVHTDSAQFINLVVLKTDGFKPEVEIKLPEVTMVPKKLVFTTDGARLIMLWMDGYKGTRGAMLFDLAKGKLVKKIGPAQHAEVAQLGDEQLVTLTSTKTGRDGSTLYTVTAYRAKDLRKRRTSRLTVKADMRLKRPDVRVLYWTAGHLQLVGMQRGSYDKKRDMRLPERAVRYDLQKRKIVWSEEPKDVVAWTKATNMRPNHTGQRRFLEVSDDLQTLQVVDEMNNLGSVKTPVAWKLYEPKSLRQQESWDGKLLYFSMTVDPVNRDAVKRKKADPERLDLYRLDAGPKATPLGQVLTKKQRFSWAPGDRFFAYMVRLKGFGRGAKEIRLYTVK